MKATRSRALAVLIVMLSLVEYTTADVRAFAKTAPLDRAAFNQVVADVTLANEGHPLGIPSYYSFYDHGEIDNPLPPRAMTAATAWGVIFEAAEGSGSVNTRVEVRNLQLQLWSKSRRTWVVYQATGAPSGQNFDNPGSGPTANLSYPAALRKEADGGISVKMDHGAWFHFWGNRVSIATSDIGGAFTTFQARLVQDDPNGPDDTASARYVAAVGADWWASKTAPWPANLQVLYGRFRYIGTDWRSFNGATWTPAQLSTAPPNLHAMG